MHSIWKFIVYCRYILYLILYFKIIDWIINIITLYHKKKSSLIIDTKTKQKGTGYQQYMCKPESSSTKRRIGNSKRPSREKQNTKRYTTAQDKRYQVLRCTAPLICSNASTFRSEAETVHTELTLPLFPFHVSSSGSSKYLTANYHPKRGTLRKLASLVTPGVTRFDRLLFPI